MSNLGKTISSWRREMIRKPKELYKLVEEQQRGWWGAVGCSLPTDSSYPCWFVARPGTVNTHCGLLMARHFLCCSAFYSILPTAEQRFPRVGINNVFFFLSVFVLAAPPAGTPQPSKPEKRRFVAKAAAGLTCNSPQHCAAFRFTLPPHLLAYTSWRVCVCVHSRQHSGW